MTEKTLIFLIGQESKFLNGVHFCSYYLHEVVWFCGFFFPHLSRVRILSFLFSLCSRNNIMLMAQKGRRDGGLLPAPLLLLYMKILERKSSVVFHKN